MAFRDYTEGSWVPAVNTSNSNMTGISYTIQDGRYQRVGNWVTVNCTLQWTNSGAGTGNVRITGFPYAAANVSTIGNRIACECQNITFPNTGNYMMVNLNAGATNASLQSPKTATTETALATTTFTNAVVIFNGTYYIGS